MDEFDINLEEGHNIKEKKRKTLLDKEFQKIIEEKNFDFEGNL